MIEARFELDLSPLQGATPAEVNRAVRMGVSKAASPVKSAVIARAQSIARYGFLAKAQRIRVRVYGRRATVAIVGASTRYQRTKGKFSRGARAGQPRRIIPAKYAHLVEKGTRHAGARPFLRPALDQAGPRYLDDVRRFTGEKLLDILRRRRA